ncbi:PTS sugar transporter subunit IIA [uncultured Parolsenella sp.]|uniref:PTS sugar transporter subunit IIA n=1 Tax=uncultured Parolsenella sp. TaxID=2083008 RepID=UPI0025EA6C05|nr:PTS sugar transporter subunit IIA [uncultured Parolsenella sp.]
MANLQFDESLVLILDKEGLTTADVVSTVADELRRQGYARDSYKQAILDREQQFPTALDVQGLNVAIPHCDPENVERGAICAAVLKHPVDWHRMDEPEQTCPVSLVVMLALNEAHAHLEMLQKVIALIQDQELTKRIVSAATPAEAYELMAPHLL